MPILWTVTSRRWLVIVSTYFTIALNVPFFIKVYAYLWDLEQSNILFWIVVPLVAFAIFFVSPDGPFTTQSR